MFVAIAGACAGIVATVTLPGDVAALGLFMAIMCGVAAPTFYSIERYSGVGISKGRLIVGRETVALTDIDPDFGVQTSAVLPPQVVALLTDGVVAPLNIIRMSPKQWRAECARHGVKLLGGSWGVPVGYKMLVVHIRDGSSTLLAAFSSVHPERTSAALTKAVQQAHGRII
jgi:hypothetical protein